MKYIAGMGDNYYRADFFDEICIEAVKQIDCDDYTYDIVGRRYINDGDDNLRVTLRYSSEYEKTRKLLTELIKELEDE